MEQFVREGELKLENQMKIYLPSFIDIQKSLQILRKIFPQYFNESMINKLFHDLRIKLSKPDSYESKTQSELVLKNDHLHKTQLSSLSQMRRQLKSKLSKIPTKKSIGFAQSSKRRHSHKGKNKNNIPFIDRRYSMFGKRGKVEEESIDIMGQLQQIWQEEHQIYLCNLYKKGKQFSQIRNLFQQKYSENKDLFTVTSIKGKFNKLIRMAISKFRHYIQTNRKRNSYPSFTMDDTLIKNIMHFKEGRKVREMLIDLYRSQLWNHNLVMLVINQINRFQIEADKHISSKIRKKI